MSATHPIGYRGVENLSTVRRSPSLMGHGKGGEIWICLTCYEGLLDDKLYRNVFGDGEDPAGLHQLIEWLNFIMPEIRSLPGFPGMITLTSSETHTIYLWVAVHRWVVYLCENPNVKKLLDDGVYVEKAFASDLFPALNGNEALYLDAQTRDFKGYASNGKPAELRWDQVLCTKLSDSLAMCNQLVEILESEAVDVSSDESEGPQGGSLGGEESHQSDSGEVEESHQSDSGEDEESHNDDSGDDEEDDSLSKTMATAPEKEQVTQAAARSNNRHLDSSATKFGPDTTPYSNSRGRKRGREGQEIEEDTDSESEERSSKRAKLAWKIYLRSPHCS